MPQKIYVSNKNNEINSNEYSGSTMFSFVLNDVGPADFTPFVGQLVDYQKDKNAIEGVISKVKPITK